MAITVTTATSTSRTQTTATRPPAAAAVELPPLPLPPPAAAGCHYPPAAVGSRICGVSSRIGKKKLVRLFDFKSLMFF
jgi:hypothetical protein